MADIPNLLLGTAQTYFLYKATVHAREANRIMREHHGLPDPTTSLSWKSTWKAYWPLLFMVILTAVSWIPFFLVRKDLDFSYTVNGDHVSVIVDTAESGVKTPDRLMFIAKISDNTVSYETDARIIRSATFAVTSPYTQMEAVMSESFEKYLGTLPVTVKFVVEIVCE